jgi:DNA-binding HxlR family transcriptional regulator
MKSRSYNHYCGLAYALDVVGERWIMLIVRELIAGPRRFKDLMEGLPGEHSADLRKLLEYGYL